jgi:hypothetical protein
MQRHKAVVMGTLCYDYVTINISRESVLTFPSQSVLTHPSLQGFLPEGADEFVATFLYPAFSPSIGIFLACSTAYGIWKTRQEG